MSSQSDGSAACVCGHASAHHDKRKSVYAGLMADYKVVWACGWKGCGCPRFVKERDTKWHSHARADLARWKDENLCVRCEQLLTSPVPCQPDNLPSRPRHKSVADLMGETPLNDGGES